MHFSEDYFEPSFFYDDGIGKVACGDGGVGPDSWYRYGVANGEGVGCLEFGMFYGFKISKIMAARGQIGSLRSQMGR